MKRIRIDRHRARRERPWREVLPADPRDPDVVRVKALARVARASHRHPTATEELSMRVLLAGASGAIGIPLIRQLHAGHDVLAIRKTAQGRERLAAAGATLCRSTCSTGLTCSAR